MSKNPSHPITNPIHPSPIAALGLILALIPAFIVGVTEALSCIRATQELWYRATCFFLKPSLYIKSICNTAFVKKSH